MDPSKSVKAIQAIFDPRCLAYVNINPESRVKASEGAAEKILDEQGWRVNSPRRAEQRGGSVIFDVPHAGEIVRELAGRNVLVDFRPGAGIRIGPHFFNSDEEVEAVVAEIKSILETKAYEKHLTAGGAKF